MALRRMRIAPQHAALSPVVESFGSVVVNQCETLVEVVKRYRARLPYGWSPRDRPLEAARRSPAPSGQLQQVRQVVLAR